MMVARDMQFNTKVDDKILQTFREVVYMNTGLKKGALSKALEEAMLDYIAKHLSKTFNEAIQDYIAKNSDKLPLDLALPAGIASADRDSRR